MPILSCASTPPSGRALIEKESQRQGGLSHPGNAAQNIDKYVRAGGVLRRARWSSRMIEARLHQSIRKIENDY